MHTQRVVLKVEAFDAVTAKEGLTSQNAVAKRMGVAQTTIGDARKGGAVGHKFIARATAAFGVAFEDIFEVAA